MKGWRRAGSSPRVVSDTDGVENRVEWLDDVQSAWVNDGSVEQIPSPPLPLLLPTTQSKPHLSVFCLPHVMLPRQISLTMRSLSPNLRSSPGLPRGAGASAAARDRTDSILVLVDRVRLPAASFRPATFGVAVFVVITRLDVTASFILFFWFFFRRGRFERRLAWRGEVRAKPECGATVEARRGEERRGVGFQPLVLRAAARSARGGKQATRFVIQVRKKRRRRRRRSSGPAARRGEPRTGAGDEAALDTRRYLLCYRPIARLFNSQEPTTSSTTVLQDFSTICL